MEQEANAPRDSETAGDPRDLNSNDQFGDQTGESDAALDRMDSLVVDDDLTGRNDLSADDVAIEADEDSD